MGNGARTEMTDRLEVSPGENVVFSFYARIPSDTTGNVVAQLAWWADGSTTSVSSFSAGNYVVLGSVPQRVSVQAVVPAGVTRVTGAAYLWREATVSSSVNMLVDWALLEKTIGVGDYFDGSYAVAGVRVKSLSWSGTAHASSSTLEYYEPGTGSPYFGQVVPRKQVSIEKAGVPIYTGMVEDWNFDYALNNDSIAESVCVDGFAVITQSALSGLSNSVESSDERIATVLDDIAWPATRRVLSAGTVDVTDDTVSADVNPLTYMQKVETSEAGALFMDKEGNVRFRNKTEGQTFPSGGLVFGPDGIPFSDLAVVYGTEEMTNQVIVDYMSGSAVAGSVTVTDSTSVGKYGPIDKKYETLLTSSLDATDLATWQVGLYAEPQYRVDSITVLLHGLPSNQQQDVLNLELGDAISVSWTPNNVGQPISQTVVVDAIEHRIGQVEHFVTFTLSQTVSAFILDDATYGVLGTGILGF